LPKSKVRRLYSAERLVDKLRERSRDVGAQKMMGEINAKTLSILEACNFQDISGQRTNKVINIINYLEQRILAMIEIWGVEGFTDIEVEDEELDADAALLQGPQLDGQGISQDDIDSMFD
jgi:chemotaxis regulatin CheY-phosphate phosphatase CheZ